MGAFKALAGFVVFGSIVFAAFQLVPPEMNNYSFQDDLQNIAMMSASNPRQTDADIVNAIIAKAQQRGFTLNETQVTVQRIGTPGAPAVYVAADYTVPVNLAVYSLTLHFTPSSGNRGF